MAARVSADRAEGRGQLLTPFGSLSILTPRFQSLLAVPPEPFIKEGLR